MFQPERKPQGIRDARNPGYRSAASSRGASPTARRSGSGVLPQIQKLPVGLPRAGGIARGGERARQAEARRRINRDPGRPSRRYYRLGERPEESGSWEERDMIVLKWTTSG
jgi:hypothetical protein